MNMNSRNVTYSKVGDYLLPNLTLPQQEKALGKYGRLRRTYLMILYASCGVEVFELCVDVCGKLVQSYVVVEL